MANNFRIRSISGWLTLVGIGLLVGLLWPASIYPDDGVFCRFKVIQPAPASYYIEVGGYIHVPYWHLPSVILPADGPAAQLA